METYGFVCGRRAGPLAGALARGRAWEIPQAAINARRHIRLQYSVGFTVPSLYYKAGDLSPPLQLVVVDLQPVTRPASHCICEPKDKLKKHQLLEPRGINHGLNRTAFIIKFPCQNGHRSEVSH